jgi:hypothetical protein
MKKFIAPFAVFLICLACNSTTTTDKENNADEADAAPVEKAMLTDISKATALTTLLCQNWENKEDAEEAALSGGASDFEMPYRGFSFFADNTVVQNPRDAIKFGKWALDEATKIITIAYDGGGSAKYKIGAVGAKDMVLINLAEKKSVEYIADGKAQKSITNDPFYGSNNLWRKKPIKAETDGQVKARLLQCVDFYHKFLVDNVGREGKVVSFVGLPAIFKWYAGGISVTGKDKLDPKWIHCFNNASQAYKAHAMLEDVISKKYKWNKKEVNWVKQDAEVVKQIYDTLTAAKYFLIVQ